MRRLLGLVSAVMLLLGLTAVASPAQAAPVTCFSGYACLNDGGMYGTRIFLNSPSSKGCHYPSTRNTADWASNATGVDLLVFDLDNCGGVSSRVYARTTGDLGGWSNKINTVKWATG
jgi:hypothetical protein